MKKTNVSSNVAEYGIYLASELKELNISQKELAEAVEISDKTISRYIKGDREKPVPDKTKEKIESYLEKKRYFREYRHMPAKEFSELSRKIFNEFEGEITQESLAKKSEISNQSRISKILDPYYCETLTAEEQFKILYTFMKQCLYDPEQYFDPSLVREKYYKTASELYMLLTGNEETFGLYEAYYDHSEYKFIDNLINYFITLPVNAQNIIMSAPDAFFESLRTLYLDNRIEYSHPYQFIKRFREMTQNGRIHLQHKLEYLSVEKRILTYYDFKDNWELFDIVTDYRCMIKNANDRHILDPSGAITYFGERIDGIERIKNYTLDHLKSEMDMQIERDTQLFNFKKILLNINNDLFNEYEEKELMDLVINDIDFRLKMSPYEWYIWMLCASYIFAMQEDYTLLKLFKEAESIKEENTEF